MATCFTCKAYFDPKSRQSSECPRCQTNNREWFIWQRQHPVEFGGLQGLLEFVRPHYYLPLWVCGFSILLGILFTYTFWQEIREGFRVLVLLVTVVGSVLFIQGFYEERLRVREQELLRQVRTGWRKGINAQMTTLLMPAIGAAFVLALMYGLMKFSDLWELVRWLAYIDAPELGDNLAEKVQVVLPFVSLAGYSVLTLTFVASSALMLARRYVNTINNFVPQPIFLDTMKLTEVVRREAEIVLGRIEPESMNARLTSFVQVEGEVRPDQLRLPPEVNMPVLGEMPLPPRVDLRIQAANWIWDELERTSDGGIRMKVARQEIYALPSRDGQPSSRIAYVVQADWWGRITQIAREVKES